MSTCRRMKLDSNLITGTNINSKWMKDLNLKPETLILLEEKHRENTSRYRHSQELS